MAEPTSLSTAGGLTAGVGLAAMWPGIDGDALIGAFAGATLFVVSAKSLPTWQRLVYLLVSVVAGYQSGIEIVRWIPIRSTGVAAFVASAVAITITLTLIEKSRAFDLNWLRRGGPPNA
ncbi:phage holin family protein [Lysobacter capsici]|uniref:putative holin n=1 Tax=Lysobacter TaxID=68 RepID=UPI00177B60E8|nr:putative holin [Lysobacter capsici]UOF16466.1 phage holin family protein [Lysobacter capsici]